MDLENFKKIVKSKILKFPCASFSRGRRNIRQGVESGWSYEPLCDLILDTALRK